MGKVISHFRTQFPLFTAQIRTAAAGSMGNAARMVVRELLERGKPFFRLLNLLSALWVVFRERVHGAVVMFTERQLTSNANTPITMFAIWHYFQVSARQGMAFYAMRFLCVARRMAYTAHDVFLRRYWLNMHRIYTMSYSTKMVTVKTTLNMAHEQQVHQAVAGIRHMVARNAHRVAAIFALSDPFPTRNAFVEMRSRNLNVGKQAGEQFRVHGKSGIMRRSHIRSFLADVIRLVRKFALPVGPFCILPQKAVI
jgi:hypothetical protein